MSGPEQRGFRRVVPAGDDRERQVCERCGFIDYENPKVVVGALVVSPDDRILLCRRAIEPRVGFWTHPSGHLERGETAEEGAVRECWEEARARIEIGALLGVHTSAEIGVVEVVYEARLLVAQFAPGPESLEVALFRRDEIPWEEIAFPTTRWALERAAPGAGARRAAAGA